MADSKISALTSTTLQSTDDIPINRAGVNYRAKPHIAGCDDYEEGTWTPIIGGDGGQSGQSYSSQTGYYTKIGNIVHCSAYIVMTTKGTITGNLQIDNLPFTVSQVSAASFGLANLWTLTASHILVGYAYAPATTIILKEVEFNNDNAINLTTSAVANGTTIIVSVSYEI